MRLGCQVKNGVGAGNRDLGEGVAPATVEESGDELTITNVAMHEEIAIAAGDSVPGRDVSEAVEIPRICQPIEIHDHDIRLVLEQPADQIRPYEAGAASD